MATKDRSSTRSMASAIQKQEESINESITTRIDNELTAATTTRVDIKQRDEIIQFRESVWVDRLASIEQQVKIDTA
jgi:hypothetical protein